MVKPRRLLGRALAAPVWNIAAKSGRRGRAPSALIAAQHSKEFWDGTEKGV
jgi:hypothetical protein